MFPLGVFLVFHLYENSFGLAGPVAYDARIHSLRSLPYLLPIEIALIYVPLAFHAGYGLYIWYTGKNNFPQYCHVRNGLYTFQRLTGVVTLLFVIYHVIDQRLLPMPSYFTVRASLSHPAVFGLYFVGIAAAALHLGSGIWNFFVKWGVTIGQNAQSLSLKVFGAAGVLLALVGLRALTGFMG
ncbi:MAG: succinate dehydrogenase [Nitrospirae bacterium]|nr:succinate dehydrogenase [Nitrospirota bacterium]